jgi:hypothetical protein
MADNDFLRQTLSYYRDQRQRILEQQLRPVDLIIRQIESELGEASEGSSYEAPFVLPPLSADGGQITKPATNNKLPELRGDEFFGKSQGEAARAYVTKVGHAVQLEEIFQGLTKGGCHVGGAEPLRTLYISLIRNTKDFVKLPNGLIGLRTMYPDLRPSAGTVGKPKDKAKGKRKGKTKAKAAQKNKGATSAKTTDKKAKREPPATASPEQPPDRQPLPIKATVQELLADGVFQHKETIVQKVQEKVGMGARAFTIYGLLNKEKYFERQGDQYRLKSAA